MTRRRSDSPRLPGAGRLVALVRSFTAASYVMFLAPLWTAGPTAQARRDAGVRQPCGLTASDVNAVVSAFRRSDDTELGARTEQILDAHHVAHGWDGWIHEKHPIGFEPSPSCEAHALSTLLDAALRWPSDAMETAGAKIAAALERNGRSDDARAIRRAYVEFETPWPNERERGLELLAAGEYTWALYHFSNHRVRGGCGTFLQSFREERDRDIAKCLRALGRWSELRKFSGDRAWSEQGSTPCQFEFVLDACVGERCIDPVERAFRDVAAQDLPRARQALAPALTHWEILSSPPDEAALRLLDLLDGSGQHFDEAGAILRRAGPWTTSYWAAQLDARRDRWSLEEGRLLSVLVEHGPPEIDGWLDWWAEAVTDTDGRETVRRAVELRELLAGVATER